jgi:hypothetical protein
MADVQKLARDFLIKLYMRQGHSPQQAAAMARDKLGRFDPMQAEVDRVDNDPLRGDPLWAPGSVNADLIAANEQERRANAAIMARKVLPGADTQPRFDLGGNPAFQPPPFAGEEARANETGVMPGTLDLPPDTEADMPVFPKPPPPVFVGEEARADERPRAGAGPAQRRAVPVPVPVPAEAGPAAPLMVSQEPPAATLMAEGPLSVSGPSEGDSPSVADYFRRKRNWKDEQGLLGRVL